METGCAKILDEACNHHNEVYCDEVLYAAWAEVPHTASDDERTPAGGSSEAYNVDVDAFMARLYASQE